MWYKCLTSVDDYKKGRKYELESVPVASLVRLGYLIETDPPLIKKKKEVTL